MEILELLRNTDSATEVLSALSTYVASLKDVTSIPDWCLSLPLRDEADVRARMIALVAVVNDTSKNLLYRDCATAKSMLQAFAAAAWALRPRKKTSR